MNDIIGSMTFESIFFMLDGGDTSNGSNGQPNSIWKEFIDSGLVFER